MMDLLEVALPTSESASSPSSTIVLTTISSDGKINLYDLARLPSPAAASKGKGKKAAAPEPAEAKEIEPVASYDTDKTRLTCVCAIGLVERKKGKDGEEVEESSDEEDGEEDEEEDGTEEEEQSEGEEEEEAEFEGFEDEEEGEVE